MGLETLVIVGIAASLAAGAVGAVGAIQQGKAVKRAEQYNAKVKENDAIAKKQQSAFATDRLRERRSMIRGREITAASKSGRGLSGSVGDVMFSNDVQTELSAMSELYKGTIDANRDYAGAQLHRMAAKNAVTQSYYQAGSSILTGVSNAAMMSSMGSK